MNSITKMNIPKELWRLVDALWQGGMDEPDLFTISCPLKELRDIRECLDTGADFPACSPHAIAETLVRYDIFWSFYCSTHTLFCCSIYSLFILL